MAVDVIRWWVKRPVAKEWHDSLDADTKYKYNNDGSVTVRTSSQKATIHYPMTDEEEAREEKIKENDAKGIDTPIDDLI